MWRARLDPPPDVLARLARSLGPDELAAAGRKRFARLRDAAVASAGTLRSLLALYAGVPAAALAFERGPHGKPSLRSGAVRFNLSHAGDVLLVAVAADREVGIDVEELVPGRVDDPLAERVLSPRELALWRAAPAEQRAGLFFRAWTHKEACVKAAGTGLSADPRAVEVLLAGPGGFPVLATELADSPRRWVLRELDLGPALAAALAAEPPPPAVHTWGADDLLRAGPAGT